MSLTASNDSLIEVFLYETSQNIEQLEQIIYRTEGKNAFSEEDINEIFRIMHTIKGSAAMMSFDQISTMAHRVEDMFFFIRENPSASYDVSELSDLVLVCMDCVNKEMPGLQVGEQGRGNCESVIGRIESMLENMKKKSSGKKDEVTNKYRAVITFEQGCAMENIRAFSVVQDISGIAESLSYEPSDLMDNDDTAEVIRDKGFVLHITTKKSLKELTEALNNTVFLKDLEITDEDEVSKTESKAVSQTNESAGESSGGALNMEEYHTQPQSIISVNVSKLDKLMDLMGETIIAEAMTTENNDIIDLEIPNFRKSAMRLRKIILEMQEMVMSLRMVPVAATFQKMHRIVRDMNKKLGKNVKLLIEGEDTDVDKNIIEHLSDPLMHLVRNCIDHGIETEEERLAAGKPAQGTIYLTAENAGGEVIITVEDDGKGLDRKKILEKARKAGIVDGKSNELPDRSVYNLIFLPGFSTNDKVTEYSGRGVGMDVVAQNISAVGGAVSVDSIPGQGMTVTLKIPLTIAIIDGMNVMVGKSRFTVPTSAIRECFRPKSDDIFFDSDGNEIIMVRGECMAILRLYKIWGVETDVTDPTEGILMIVEYDGKKRCVFVDKLVGRQQVVVKTLPKYIKKSKRLAYLSGCTLLGDGRISLILDAGWLVSSDI
ncbi:MAG: chemotaxis protein CheA [Clostridiaceae bacterium]|nr:chemotaxis protein CheA [Clostridiaceae bacterium]